MFEGHTVTAVVLAAGSGRRMQREEKKQFIEILGHPLYSYSLRSFLQSPWVDKVILVSGEEDLSKIRREVRRRKDWYGISEEEILNRKKLFFTAGGRERRDSVYAALRYMEREIILAEECHFTREENTESGRETAGKEPREAALSESYILIQDSARPMLKEKMIEDSLRALSSCPAVCVGMPVKDTIKLVDPDNFVSSTPDRSSLWLTQTPQSFHYPLLLRAYRKLYRKIQEGEKLSVTDDAMVVESMERVPVKIIRGSYENIKVTTAEDLILAEAFLRSLSGSP